MELRQGRSVFDFYDGRSLILDIEHKDIRPAKTGFPIGLHFIPAEREAAGKEGMIEVFMRIVVADSFVQFLSQKFCHSCGISIP